MIARQGGMDLRFVEEEGESPIHHPNTAVLQMTGDKTRVTVAGCSIGGGIIEIRAINLDGVDILPAGPLPIVIFRDYSKQMANALAINTDLEEKAPFTRRQVLRADDCDIYVYDIKKPMQPATIAYFEKKYPAAICL